MNVLPTSQKQNIIEQLVTLCKQVKTQDELAQFEFFALAILRNGVTYVANDISVAKNMNIAAACEYLSNKAKYVNAIQALQHIYQLKQDASLPQNQTYLIPENENVYGYVFYQNTKITDSRQLDFRNRGDQSGYFQNRVLNIEGILPVFWNSAPPLQQDAKYITFRIAANINILADCDYISVMPNGPLDITHELYCKILNMKYVAYETTEVSVEIDWFQSNMFIGARASTTRGWDLGQSFVERKLDSSFSGSVPKRNVQPENVGVVNYKKVREHQFLQNGGIFFTVIVTSTSLSCIVNEKGEVSPNGNQPDEPSPLAGVNTYMGISHKPYAFYIFPHDANGNRYRVAGERPGGDGEDIPSFSNAMKIISWAEQTRSKIVTVFQTSFLPCEYSMNGDTMTIGANGVTWDWLHVHPPENWNWTGPNTGLVVLPRLNDVNALVRHPYTLSDAYDFNDARNSKLYLPPYSRYIVENEESVLEFNPTLCTIPNNIGMTLQVSYDKQADGFLAINGYDTNITTETQYNKSGLFKVSYDIPFLFDNAALISQANAINRQKNTINLVSGVLSVGTSAAQGAILGSISSNKPTNEIDARTGAAISTSASLLNTLTSYTINEVTQPWATNREYNKAPLNGNDVQTSIYYDTQKSGIFVNIYIPSDEERAKLDNFFSTYGYTVNQVEIPNMRAHVRFDYLKLSQPTISVTNNAVQVNVLQDLFTNGVHIFHVDNPNADVDINFTATNGVR